MDAMTSHQRDDEPTRIAPLHYSGIQVASKREQESPPESTHASAPPAQHAAPFSIPPSRRSERSGSYRLSEPPNGSTDVLHSDAPPPPAQAPRQSTIREAPAAAARTTADDYFAAAERLMQRGDYRGAVFAAQNAIKLQQPQPFQQALYAWLLYQRDGGSGPVRNHVWHHIDGALLRDERCAVAHCIKGLLLQRAHRTREARVHLARAEQLAIENRSERAHDLLKLDRER
jgi:hypothetical protein